MIVVGSAALRVHGVQVNRPQLDVDVIASTEDTMLHIKNHLRGNLKGVQYNKDATHVYAFLIKREGADESDPGVFEYEIAWENSTGAELIDIVMGAPDLYTVAPTSYGDMVFVSPGVVLALKLSHRYKKNSRHFYKTMHDIRRLRSLGYEVPEVLKEWLQRREKETYTYNHPKLQGVTKDDFFSDDGIRYVYDHDSIHEVVAHMHQPAYKFYQPEGEQVGTSKEMFFDAPKVVQLLGVLEESYVLSLERSIIPFDLREQKDKHRVSFEMALEKVCTSITSGWFREFAWENFETVRGMYDAEYVERFFAAADAGQVRLYKKEMM